MHSSLRIFQITLIITQITTVESFFLNVTSTASTVLTYSTVTSAGSPVKSMQTTAVSPTSNVTSSSLQPSKTSDVQSSSTLTVSSTTNVFSVTGTETIAASPESTVNASLSETSTTSIVSSSSLQAAGSLMTTAHVTSSTEQLTKVGNISATLSKLLTSKQLESSVPGNTTKTGSQTNIVSITTSMEPATTTTNAISVASTEATNLSPSGLLTSQTQSITANYLLSSASRRTSIVLTTAESKQTLTTSLAVSVSVNWTDWSVDSCDCQQYCSEKGGTVTASRHCYSHLKTLEDAVCTQHANLEKVFKCSEHCPISGKEAFGSSISTLAVSILLVMLS